MYNEYHYPIQLNYILLNLDNYIIDNSHAEHNNRKLTIANNYKLRHYTLWLTQSNGLIIYDVDRWCYLRRQA